MRGFFAFTTAVVCLLVTCVLHGQAPFTDTVVLTESEIAAFLRDGKTVVSLPFEVRTARAVEGRLSLEWIGTAAVVRELTLRPGRNVIETPLPLPESNPYLRLRYKLEPRAARTFDTRQSIVALSSIAKHVFEVKVGHVGKVVPGKPYAVHAQAIEVGSRGPAEGVTWKATIEVKSENGTGMILAARITPLEGGFAEIVFDVPANVDDGPGIQVTGTKGDFSAESTARSFRDQRASAVQTDKPIYQPEQIIHVRGVLWDKRGRAAEGRKVTLEIEDEDFERVHTAKLTSSRFGVVSDDWTVPASARLGGYRIYIRDDEEAQILAQHAVQVSRYELPTFDVMAKPDRKAYLPGQAVRITVEGKYFFGKPVSRGKVKIARTEDGEWNPRTRKYESNDETVAEGEAASDGTFSTQLDVKDEFDDWRDRDRFQDLHYAAYVTDPTTGRTEQRKFDVRITKEPVHVYIIPARTAGRLGMQVYVTTFYADGRPAETTVELSGEGVDKVTLRTNAYGVGKVTINLPLDDSPDLTARAMDGMGLAGQWTQWVHRRDETELQLDTPKTMYRGGEPVQLRVRGSGEKTVMVVAVADGFMVARQVAKLRGGVAEVAFPYQETFRGVVTFGAWDGGFVRDTYHYAASRAVLFPMKDDLKLTVTPERAEYKPGSKAAVRFAVKESSGAGVESALGVAVVDEAVLARARTDAEFGERPWFRCAYCNSGEREIGGFSVSGLARWDWRKPVPQGLDLVAETLLADEGSVTIEAEESDPTGGFEMLKTQLKDLRAALAGLAEFPRSMGALSGVLGRYWLAQRDPWDRVYGAEFRVEQTDYVVEVTSSGPDKTTGTEDDFSLGEIRRPYFQPVRQLAVPILLDMEEFAGTDDVLAALRKRGLDLEKLQDPWGTGYRVEVRAENGARVLEVRSAGPDRQFATSDDVEVDQFRKAYFVRPALTIQRALRGRAAIPANEAEFVAMAREAGVDLEALRDPWSRPYRVERREVPHYMNYRGAPGTAPIPVTQTTVRFTVQSLGRDGEADTDDDFELMSANSEIAGEVAPGSVGVSLPRGAAAIAGSVTDQSGAAVANVKVELRGVSGTDFETVTSATGQYMFVAPEGGYSLVVEAPGFKAYRHENIQLTEGRALLVHVELELGTTTEMITVTAQAALMKTESASVSLLPIFALQQGLAVALSTPRVREYFPETLLWAPEIVTDAEGEARLEFPLADAVTNWKVAVFASTIDGQTTEAIADIRAFQPFFVDFQPPPVLTSGDRVDVPVTVRNYTKRDENITVEMGGKSQKRKVAANAAENVVFPVRAGGPAEVVKKRVVARAGKVSDAIEREVKIHPDGQEVTRTSAEYASGRTEFVAAIPAGAIAGATRGEVRLYPGTLALLVESAHASMIIPHGCAEQTVSAGWSNLIALQFAQSVKAENTAMVALAKKNIEKARDDLQAFEDGDGYSYWPGGKADIAVTAQALQFLAKASDVIAVDRDDLEELVKWLEQQQRPDGRWVARWEEDQKVTALVARSLAAAKREGVPVKDASLIAAFNHMAKLTDDLTEPYMLAQFVLAALDAGDASVVLDAVDRLVRAGQTERGGVFWDLRSNSPFYGWGTAGRVETSGLVIEALAKWRAGHADRADLEEPIRKGLAFVLRTRDRWGGWYSTQATLRAMQAVTAAEDVLGAKGLGGRVDVRVNGRLMKTVVLPDDPRVVDPIYIDISAAMAGGENRVELMSGGSLLAQTVVTHWVPWEKADLQASDELRLSVAFDRREAGVGEAIEAKVKAERVGFRGYGMMLAEIGLPPGVEVDRSSFDKVLEAGGVDRYEIQPDRVVVYLWPQAGGTEFAFTVRPRMTMTAKPAASVLYDYYNPEARAEVTPVRFEIR